MRRILVLILAFVSLHASAQEQWAVVNVSDCFLREEPRYGSECVSQSRMGTPVQVLERKGYWVRIKTPEPYEGWVNELSLAPTRELSPEEQKTTGLYGATFAPMSGHAAEAYVATKKIISLKYGEVKVRENSTIHSKVIRTIERGNMLRLANDDGILHKLGWNKVLLPDGKEGWIMGNGGSFVSMDEWAEKEAAEADSIKTRDIVKIAEEYLGTPYLWGGMSPGHFDCSGLVGFCYFMNGVLLPRDASQQAQCGVEVPFEDMKEGDLVFFGNTGVGHVAICIGNHRIIHASQLVRINSLIAGEPDYYGRNILHIRRIIGHIGEGSDAFKPTYIKDSSAYFPQTK